MTVISDIAYVAFFVGTIGACGLAVLAVTHPAPEWSRTAVRAVAGLGLVSLAARWAEVGHPPIFGTFENTLTAAACLVAAAVATSWRREAPGSWAWAAPWALALLLYGTLFRRTGTPLTISEQSLWVDVHVVFAWLAFVALALASSLALVRATGRTYWGMGHDEADEQIARLLNLGFLALTATMVVGAWYLYVLFAEFWRWDVVGTLTLVAWLGYGMVIHARYFYGLAGRRLTAVVLAVLPVLLLAFWIWSVFPGTYHYFDIPLMKPY